MVQRARDAVKSAYLQAIDPDKVLNEDHLLLSLSNVVAAHKYRYNRMNRIDSELLLVLAGVNNFESALRSLAPKGERDAVLVSFSADREGALESLRSFELNANAPTKEVEFNNDRGRLLRIMELHGIPEKSLRSLDEGELTEALVEKAAVFYARYR